MILGEDGEGCDGDGNEVDAVRPAWMENLMVRPVSRAAGFVLGPSLCHFNRHLANLLGILAHSHIIAHDFHAHE